jgi:ubiquinone/menaquinone biosynthesis C-methylase UbiE
MQKKYNYNSFEYDCIERWASYYYQISEVIKLKPEKIIEVGSGNGTVRNYLSNLGIKVMAVDIEKENNPDILASVEKIPVVDNFVDLILCAEVLEHLPFDKFIDCLKEIKRVTKKYAIISLPHWGRHFAMEFKLPYFKKIQWQYKFSLFPKKHKFNGYHYWEIGKKDYKLNLIKNKMLEAGFEIIDDYIAFEMPYHHFFILKK